MYMYFRYVKSPCIDTFIILVLIRRGHLEIVKLLLNGNLCQVNAVNKKGETALHLTLQ